MKQLTKEEIKQAYDDFIFGFDEAMNRLINLGMSEHQADDYLIPPTPAK